MTPEEMTIEQAAFEFARANRATLARQIADIAVYFSEVTPFTVFMAGSPGAGKTEVSKAMAEDLDERNLNLHAKRVSSSSC